MKQAIVPKISGKYLYLIYALTQHLAHGVLNIIIKIPLGNLPKQMKCVFVCFVMMKIQNPKADGEFTLAATDNQFRAYIIIVFCGKNCSLW